MKLAEYRGSCRSRLRFPAGAANLTVVPGSCAGNDYKNSHCAAALLLSHPITAPNMGNERDRKDAD